MLALVTGPVRSGKSGVALRLAAQSGREMMVAAGGRPDDEEMARRIERHLADRSDSVRVMEVTTSSGWVAEVPDDVCLLVDCLGTVLGQAVAELVDPAAETVSARAEREVGSRADALVKALVARAGDTVVVSNETGWGVVPASPAGRLFRDVMGRATRQLADAADVAVLVVAGRCVDLRSLPKEAEWPR
ncbi:bifunctional adenosylcobinamide kinase/adenosylcobinamide-phosphate guanylyltransferase [Anaerosoma tenue]|uniref:bifunctional adenosylcobinamide kinase/adenosylcobinamide-phosphate guanylyltransferase n=1 Tax=Anaerosoma tenue TaxID=2933588 RepID=UPI002260929C|nr:bifunctional adenosylcobinamide kinase/adenosylcobinamide-phosphate guanylyltransferase [Anaerosoma tenue]MCK8114116.1 bifunctional adenosylcobinamide kinase/adenosylcobinamide-phosphate guanylyltransferase [Anaerosoma tenue]